MSELTDIQPSRSIIKLGGHERVLRYGFKAWAILEEKYGNIQGVFEALKNKPFNVLPDVVFAGMVKMGDEEVTFEKVLDWMDEYGISDLQPILEVVKDAITQSLPAPKKGPAFPKAKTRK